jgi:hypothetical protein
VIGRNRYHYLHFTGVLIRFSVTRDRNPPQNSVRKAKVIWPMSPSSQLAPVSVPGNTHKPSLGHVPNP